MATKADENESQTLQQFNIKQRRALNNAYAAIAAQQNVTMFSAFTFEEAVDQQVERIEGKGTRVRPNAIERVNRIEAELLQSVDQLKKVPPDRFVERDPEEDVNTDVA